MLMVASRHQSLRKQDKHNMCCSSTSPSESREDTMKDLEFIAIFEWMDADKSGTVSYQEFLLFAEYCGVRWRHDASVEAELRFVFDEVDADSSGDLTKEEVKQMLYRIGLLKQPVTSPKCWAPKPHAGFFQKVIHRVRGELATFQSSVRLLKRQTMLALSLLRHERLHGKLSTQQQSLVRRSMWELAKLVPLLLLACLPGCSLVIPLALRACPSVLPRAFHNAFSREGPASKANVSSQGNSEFDLLCVDIFRGFLRNTRVKLAESQHG